MFLLFFAQMSEWMNEWMTEERKEWMDEFYYYWYIWLISDQIQKSEIYYYWNGGDGCIKNIKCCFIYLINVENVICDAIVFGH